ncbi:MAG: tyrosine-type recombinase/integrase [Candidatus Marinimicrobia bacterium]|nr:tyrosine-type recombinase/integrase [Candidatus Neomarinimicrobiota bacterium]
MLNQPGTVTFASQLVIKGASIYDVQKLMGHKSIIMTQVYAHLSEDATRRAVDLLKFNPNFVKIQGLSSAIPRQKVIKAI